MCSSETISGEGTKAKRAEFIEIARILAAFLILMRHFPFISRTDTFYLLVNSSFCTALVPFFFLTSGYFMKNPQLGSVFKRLLILLIPFLIWDEAAIIATFGFGDGYIHKIIQCDVPHPGDWPPYENVSLWFLRDLIVFTAFYPLLHHLRKFALAIGITLLALYSSRFYSYLNLGVLSQDVFTWRLALFMLGMGLQRFDLNTVTSFFEKNWALIVSCTLPTCILFFFMNEATNALIYPDSGLQLIGIICLIAVSMGVQIHLKPVSRLCMQLSPVCYFIYLYHDAVYDLLQYQLLSPQSQQFLNDCQWVAAPIIAVILVAIAYYTVVLMRRFAPCLLPYIVGLKK